MILEQNILNLALDPVVNFGKVTVSTGYTSTDTTPILLNTGDGAKLPASGYNLVWWNWSDHPDPSDDPNVEIVRVLTRSGDALSISRAQEGTTASNKNLLGRTYKMILAQTKQTIADIQTDAQSRVNSHSALSTGIHGVGADTIDGISSRNSAIATHAGLTSSVHNFDASGNAPPQLHGMASHTGTIGTWADINKTTSNIADITTRSHTSLTDIGIKTHSQIDTHMGATSTVHNFDASGNAPPQLHGASVHDSTTVDGGAALSSTSQIPAHDSTRHTGTIGTWGQIDKTTSNISDITTKSHTSLTDIGTNTHTAIDTHISSISAHGISAGLDASKSGSPVVGQRYIAVDTLKDYECFVAGIWREITANPPLVHGIASHTGTIGAWANIDKTTSSIADITTRSHGSLTDGTISGTTNNHAAIDTAITNSTSHIAATTGIHGTTGNLVATGAAVSGQYSSAKYTTTTALNWNNGNVQYIVLASGGQTFTFANPRDGGRYMIIVKQPGTGAAGTVTWPANVLWSGGTAPTLTTVNGKVDLITFAYDLTNDKYYGGSALNY